MDGIEIKITSSSPLEALAKIGAFGMHCLANSNVNAAAQRIYWDEARKEKAAQLDAQQRQAVTSPTPVTTPTPAAPTAPVVPAASVAPVMPVTPAPVTAPTQTPPVSSDQAATVSPTEQPAAVVPPVVQATPTAAPTYSLSDITRAGADFIAQNPDKQDLLNALLPQFGITTLAELRPEQLGPFATAMRGLGVKI